MSDGGHVSEQLLRKNLRVTDEQGHELKRKAHVHFAKSIFRIGFDDLRNRLRSDAITAITPWRRLEPIPPKIARVL
jgi:hypothetical protein